MSADQPKHHMKSAQIVQIRQLAVRFFKGGRHFGQDTRTCPDYNINGNVVNYCVYVVSDSK